MCALKKASKCISEGVFDSGFTAICGTDCFVSDTYVTKVGARAFKFWVPFTEHSKLYAIVAPAPHSSPPFRFASDWHCHSRRFSHALPADMSLLAARISVSNLHKNTPDKFSKTIEKLHTYVMATGESSPLISKEMYSIVMEVGGAPSSFFIRNFFLFFSREAICPFENNLKRGTTAACCSALVLDKGCKISLVYRKEKTQDLGVFRVTFFFFVVLSFSVYSIELFSKLALSCIILCSLRG